MKGTQSSEDLQANGADKSVLIVKSKESAAASISDFLQAKGYSVIAVVSNSDAIGLTNAQSFDAIIVDLKMPLLLDRRSATHSTRDSMYFVVTAVTGPGCHGAEDAP